MGAILGMLAALRRSMYLREAPGGICGGPWRNLTAWRPLELCMSTNYFPEIPIRFDELFDGRLEPLGIREDTSDESTQDSRALTDGQNVLWFYRDRDGHASATRFGGNDPSHCCLERHPAYFWNSVGRRIRRRSQRR